MKPNELIDNLAQPKMSEPKKKAFTDYKGVEKTPYGHIYNFNGSSITDLAGQRTSMKMPVEKGKNYGFTYTKGGDEVYADTFEDAYKALGGKLEETPEDVYRAQNDIIRKNMETGKDLMDGVDQAKYNAAKQKMSAVAKHQKYLDKGLIEQNQYDELKKKFKGSDLDTAVERLAQGEPFGDVLSGVIQYEKPSLKSWQKKGRNNTLDYNYEFGPTFEKDLPYNMRFKEWDGDLENDGKRGIHWVTQDEFNDADIAKFKEAMKKHGIDKAHLILRDDSRGWNDDEKSKRGHFIDLNEEKNTVNNGKRLAAEYMDLMDKGIKQEDAERELQKRGYNPNDIKNAYGQIRYGKEYNYWKGNDDYKAVEPKYDENTDWEEWANAMDQFVPKDWETDGWDGDSRIYITPKGESVWVHAGNGVTVYPPDFKGPNDIKGYNSVTEFLNSKPKQKVVATPKKDWHELGYNLGRSNGLNDVESDELATIIYNFMQSKKK